MKEQGVRGGARGSRESFCGAAGCAPLAVQTDRDCPPGPSLSRTFQVATESPLAGPGAISHQVARLAVSGPGIA
eukprot:167469-Rhodomonas_salina.4